MELPADPLLLGNLDAVRDWGHSSDYCKAYQLMLEKVQEARTMLAYVVATDECYSVR